MAAAFHNAALYAELEEAMAPLFTTNAQMRIHDVNCPVPCRSVPQLGAVWRVGGGNGAAGGSHRPHAYFLRNIQSCTLLLSCSVPQGDASRRAGGGHGAAGGFALTSQPHEIFLFRQRPSVAAAYHTAALYGELEEAVAPLVALLQDGEARTRGNAVGALGNLARKSDELVPELLRTGAMQVCNINTSQSTLCMCQWFPCALSPAA